jgi:hypothetical protein
MGSGIIYKLDFPSRKSYIGLTEQALKDRLASHVSKSSKCPQVKKAIAKYDWSSIVVSILVELPKDLLPEYEKKFIDIFDTYRNGYNGTPGGDVSPMTCPEVAARSRATLMQPERQKRKIESYKKTRADPVVAQRFVDGLKRAHADPEKRAKYRAGWKAAQSKPEAKAKQSKIQLVVQNNPEINKRRSESLVASWALRNPAKTPEEEAKRAKKREQAARKKARALEAVRRPLKQGQGRSTPPPATARGAIMSFPMAPSDDEDYASD